MFFLFAFSEMFVTDVFSIPICWNVLNWFIIWICWNVLNWFLSYLATRASLGHPLPTAPRFLKKRFTYLIALLGCFEMFLIDFFSILMFRNGLNYFVCYLDCLKCSSMISFSICIFEIVVIDVFSLWICWNLPSWFLFYLATGASSGHPLPTRPLFWKSELHIDLDCF